MSQTSIITKQANFGKKSVPSIGTAYPALNIESKPTLGVAYDSQAATGASSPSLVRIIPYASNTSFTSVGMRIVAWNLCDSAYLAWIPTVLAEFSLTYSSGVVPDWSLDTAGEARPFAGITQLAGTPTANLFSPGTASASNTEPAAVLFDALGAQLLQVQFKATGTGSMGFLWTTI